MANAYFLIIMVLQLIPGLAQSHDWIFTLLPLIMVVGVSMIKDFYEHNKRRKKDYEENQAPVLICSGGSSELQASVSERIEVGCLVKVLEGENFPCDLILVQSSLPKGISFVETKNLDGETNLKQKNAHEECTNLLTAQKKSIFEILQSCSVNCEGPNEFLYRFSGNLLHRPSGETIPIDEKAILLRGSSLRNTEWVVGIAVYTGHETKIM